MVHIFIFPFVRPGESHQRSLMILSRDSRLYHLIHILDGAPKPLVDSSQSPSQSLTEQAVSFGSHFLSGSLVTHKSPSVGPQAITGIAQLYANYHIIWGMHLNKEMPTLFQVSIIHSNIYHTLVQSCIGLPCPSFVSGCWRYEVGKSWVVESTI